MEKRILLISRFTPEAVVIKRDIEAYTHIKVDWVRTAPEAIERLTRGNVSLLVFNLDTVNQRKIEVCRKLRGLGYEFPLVILSRFVAKDIAKIVSRMRDTVLLETPVEQKEFGGVLEKMIRGDHVRQRYYKRFYTSQAIQAEFFRHEKPVGGKVRNLSMGGAFLEFVHGHLKPGDLILLKFDLNEVQRSYNIAARVMWTIEHSPWGKGKGAGLRFALTQGYRKKKGA